MIGSFKKLLYIFWAVFGVSLLRLTEDFSVFPTSDLSKGGEKGLVFWFFQYLKTLIICFGVRSSGRM